MAHRCRTEPKYALKVYNLCKTAEGRDKFAAMFGVPPGATPLSAPDQPRLRLVR
jgi:hypothetical protein